MENLQQPQSRGDASPATVRDRARDAVSAVAEGRVSFRIRFCLKAAARLTTANLGAYAGAAIVFALFYAVSIIAFMIPVAGAVLSWTFSMVILAGFGLYGRAALLDRPRRFGMFFDGFNAFGPLFVLALLAAAIPVILQFTLFADVFASLNAAFESTPSPEEAMRKATQMMRELSPFIMAQTLIQLLIMAALMFAPFLIGMYGFPFRESLDLNFQLVRSQLPRLLLYIVAGYVLFMAASGVVMLAFTLVVLGLASSNFNPLFIVFLVFAFLVPYWVFAFSFLNNLVYLPFHQMVVYPAEAAVAATADEENHEDRLADEIDSPFY